MNERGTVAKISDEVVKKLNADREESFATNPVLFWFICVQIAITLVLALVIFFSNQSKQDTGSKTSEASAMRDQLREMQPRIDELSQKLANSVATIDPALKKQLNDLDKKIGNVDAGLASLSAEVQKKNSQIPEQKHMPLSDPEILRIAAEIRKVIEGEQFINRLGDKVQAKLTPELQKMKPSPVGSAMDPKDLQKTVRAALNDKELFDKIADAVRAKVLALPPQTPPGMATAKGVAELRAAWKTDVDELRGRLAALDKKLADASKPANLTPQLSEPLDVIVVATHSQHLPVNQSIEAYKRLFAAVPRDDPKHYRLGFYLAVTAKLQTKISLKDGKKSEHSFYVDKPTGTETEQPESLGAHVLDQFDDHRPRQRCILVASTRCEAPKPDAEGWKNIPNVDVVLVRGEGGGEAAPLTPWLDFCAGRRGSLTVLAVNEARDGKKSLENQLYENLLRLAQPSRR